MLLVRAPKVSRPMSKPCRPRKLVTHFRVCRVYGGNAAKAKGLLLSLCLSSVILELDHGLVDLRGVFFGG